MCNVHNQTWRHTKNVNRRNTSPFNRIFGFVTAPMWSVLGVIRQVSGPSQLQMVIVVARWLRCRSTDTLFDEPSKFNLLFYNVLSRLHAVVRVVRRRISLCSDKRIKLFCAFATKKGIFYTMTV
jgi:hypothetical protein